MNNPVTDLKTKLREYFFVYLRFLKNPVQEIRHLPDWSWRDQIFNQLVVTGALGALTGFLKMSPLSIIQGMIVVPIITAFTITVATFFFYFFFQVVAGVSLGFRRLMELIFFSNIPFFLFQTVAHWIPPISLFGLAMAAMLMIVGLCDNFQLQRKLVMRTVIGVYVLFVLVWAWGRLDTSRFESRMDARIQSPEVELGK